jgi:hypothetical protein
MRRLGLSVVALAVLMAVPALVHAQEGPGGLINPQRDCQTIRSCNFAPGGSYRGCVSSYSCKVCRFVKVACKNGRGKVCERLRCGWGAVG